MTECIYWLEDGNSQWCDLAGRACNCSGEDGKCSFSSHPIINALKTENHAAILQDTLKTQKKRHQGELSSRER